jgi:hypothetical protein
VVPERQDVREAADRRPEREKEKRFKPHRIETMSVARVNAPSPKDRPSRQGRSLGKWGGEGLLRTDFVVSISTAIAV